MKKKTLLSFRCMMMALLCSAGLSAQVDSLPDSTYRFPDSKVMNDVIIVARGITLDPGLHSARPDSITRSHYEAGTLTDLFAQNGTAFLKSYGGGGLATTSLRGASASQTAIMWNGVNLQSTTNGIADLSLIPAIIFDNLSVDVGAGAGGWKSGAVSGAINMSNNTWLNGESRVEAKYAAHAGSFGQFSNAGKLFYTDGFRYAVDVRAYVLNANNDFTFRNTAINGAPLDTMTHALMNQRGVQLKADRFFRTMIRSNTIHVGVVSWYHCADRQIPPTMHETVSEASQHDEFTRTRFLLEMFYHKMTIAASSSLLTEFMSFDQGFSQPVSLTHSASVVNDLNVRRRIGSRMLFVNSGMDETITKADVTEFVPVTHQHRIAAYAGVQYSPGDKLNVRLQLREELLGNKAEPLVGSIGMQNILNKYLTINSTLSRTYRVPTFNDLYWHLGGNPDLKAEDCLGGEVSGNVHWQDQHFKISYELTTYYRYTKNWIQWQPGPGYWVPQNLLEVESYGAEHRVKSEWNSGKWKVMFNAGYDYVRATNKKALFPGDSTVGLQLMYVPAGTVNGMLHVSYSEFYFQYVHQYAGIRFTSTDHTSWLPSYQTGQITFGKRFDLHDSFADAFFRINNVWNENYQAVAWRAMPGRSFEVGLTVNLYQKIKTTEQ